MTNTTINTKDAAILSEIVYLHNTFEPAAAKENNDTLYDIFYDSNGKIRTNIDADFAKRLTMHQDYYQNTFKKYRLVEVSSRLLNSSQQATGYYGIAVEAIANPGEIYIYNRGTETSSIQGFLQDFTSDIALATGEITNQADAGVNFVEHLLDRSQDQELNYNLNSIGFGGHSLGGSLAQILSVYFYDTGMVSKTHTFEAYGTLENITEASNSGNASLLDLINRNASFDLSAKYQAIDHTALNGLIHNYIHPNDRIATASEHIGSVTEIASAGDAAFGLGLDYHRIDNYLYQAYDNNGELMPNQLNIDAINQLYNTLNLSLEGFDQAMAELSKTAFDGLKMREFGGGLISNNPEDLHKFVEMSLQRKAVENLIKTYNDRFNTMENYNQSDFAGGIDSGISNNILGEKLSKIALLDFDIGSFNKIVMENNVNQRATSVSMERSPENNKKHKITLVATGEQDNEYLMGSYKHENLIGSNKDDIINGLGGSDRLFGGAGKDTYVFNDRSDDDEIVADSLNKEDKIQFENLSLESLSFVNSGYDLFITTATPVIVSSKITSFYTSSLLLKGYYHGLSVNTLTFDTGGEYNLSTLLKTKPAISMYENLFLVGGHRSEHFKSYYGNDVIYTYGGNNFVDSGFGNDVITAGHGNNEIMANEGDNHIVVGNGDNTIYADNGNNIISAGDGNNEINVGEGDNNITSGSGDDYIELVGNGNNSIIAGDGDNDIYILGNSNNRITTGNGDDDITGGDGNNTINASDGDNEIYADDGNNLITTGSGDDYIDVGDGNNTIVAGDGSNRIDVGDGSNTINAGDGDNEVYALDGNNFITTGSGDDYIAAYDGNNTIIAGDGSNEIEVGDGDNFIQTGNDQDYISVGSGNNTITAGSGDDNIVLSGGNNEIAMDSAGTTRINNADSNGGEDSLVLDGASAEDLWFYREMSHLMIRNLADEHSVTVENWFDSPDNQIDQVMTDEMVLHQTQIDQLIQAMATFNVDTGAGEIVLNPEQKDHLSSIIANTWSIKQES